MNRHIIDEVNRRKREQVSKILQGGNERRDPDKIARQKQEEFVLRKYNYGH